MNTTKRFEDRPSSMVQAATSNLDAPRTSDLTKPRVLGRRFTINDANAKPQPVIDSEVEVDYEVLRNSRQATVIPEGGGAWALSS